MVSPPAKSSLSEVKTIGKDARLIGQFGVGFYSAYLVADRVEVLSRAAGPGQIGHLWVSEAKDTFTVAPSGMT